MKTIDMDKSALDSPTKLSGDANKKKKKPMAGKRGKGKFNARK